MYIHMNKCISNFTCDYTHTHPPPMTCCENAAFTTVLKMHVI